MRFARYSALALVFLAAASPGVRAAIVFADDFTRPDSTNINGTGGQSGAVAPLSYSISSFASTTPASIANGQLVLGSTNNSLNYAGVSPNFNFGPIGSLSVSFDVNPNSNRSSTGFSGTEWGGISFGHTALSALKAYAVDTDATNAFGIIIRNSGTFRVFTQGNPGPNTVFNPSATGVEVYRVTVTISTAEVATGVDAFAQVSVNGSLLPIGGPGIYSFPFQWHNGNQNYICLGTESDSLAGTPFDGLEIRSIPEPHVLSLMTSVLLMAAVRRFASQRRRIRSP